MRFLLTLIILAAVFTGGYYVGQMPESPNLREMIQEGRRTVSETSEQAAAFFGHDSAKDSPSPAHTGQGGR